MCIITANRKKPKQNTKKPNKTGKRRIDNFIHLLKHHNNKIIILK